MDNFALLVINWQTYSHALRPCLWPYWYPFTLALYKMSQELWQQCLTCLQDELPSQQFNTWIRPLKVNEEGTMIQLVAPNRFVRDWVRDKYFSRIRELVADFATEATQGVELVVGVAGSASIIQTATQDTSPSSFNPTSTITRTPSAILKDSSSNSQDSSRIVQVEGSVRHQSYLNKAFTFSSFVQGKSNQLALAAAKQVSENPGSSYNPLFLYGGVGLGKTHLMHAVGAALIERNPNAKVVYLHSERFVADMVKALQLNAINEFKRFYRSVDALLIDDIQFFAGKERSQEEFFHTFNALLESGQQMILTCDRYPKEIVGLEDRLKSRFGWGLTVAVEPPELETRVAILMKKAAEGKIVLPEDAAFFLAKKIRSNVRELEGALKRVVANSHFTGEPISTPFIQESLRDLLALQDRKVSIDNIQKTVAGYYKIKIADILSKRRSRSVARPRQLAMALAKDLTNHSLPEIGDAFGGRDHTTVLHACRKIKELREADRDIHDDYDNLYRTLTV